MTPPDYRVVLSVEGRDVKISVEPRRCDIPSKWLRDPVAAMRHAHELSALRGWPVVDEREAAQ